MNHAGHQPLESVLQVRTSLATMGTGQKPGQIETRDGQLAYKKEDTWSKLFPPLLAFLSICTKDGSTLYLNLLLVPAVYHDEMREYLIEASPEGRYGKHVSIL